MVVGLGEQMWKSGSGALQAPLGDSSGEEAVDATQPGPLELAPFPATVVSKLVLLGSFLGEKFFNFCWRKRLRGRVGNSWGAEKVVVASARCLSEPLYCGGHQCSLLASSPAGHTHRNLKLLSPGHTTWVTSSRCRAWWNWDLLTHKEGAFGPVWLGPQ